MTDCQGTAPTFAEELAAMLWPERYPPGHRLHRPNHVFWESHADDPEYNDFFQWDAETIEWVAEAVQWQLERERRESA